MVLESQFLKFFNLFKAKRTIKYIWSMRKESDKEHVRTERIKLQLSCRSGSERIETLPCRKVSTEDLWDPIHTHFF